MRSISLRRAGVRAKVCLSWLLAMLLACANARAERQNLGDVELYPARLPGKRGVTVVLHGMCGRPENTCRHFEAQVTEREHLICPRATQACPGGGYSWAQSGYAGALEEAVQRALAALGERADEQRGRTLIGYSLGAFRALELAERELQRYPRVMLVGARVAPSQARLSRAGVERLLLCAGRADMMHDHMRREARRLQRTGFETRFLELGASGHALGASFQDFLPDALIWLADGPVPEG